MKGLAEVRRWVKVRLGLKPTTPACCSVITSLPHPSSRRSKFIVLEKKRTGNTATNDGNVSNYNSDARLLVTCYVTDPKPHFSPPSTGTSGFLTTTYNIHITIPVFRVMREGRWEGTREPTQGHIITKRFSATGNCHQKH